MKYVCIENDVVISVLDYEPNVPASVSVVTISDIDGNNLSAGTHIFDISSSSVVEKPAEAVAQENTAAQNGQEREFLNSTDWKVLRHIRQKHLGIATSLTEEQYTELENQREAAAQRVVDIE